MAVTLAPASKSEAERHAKSAAPYEACGVVIETATGQMYWPCRNVCEEPERHFVMHPRDYYRASVNGVILAIVHSHPKGGPASKLDQRACRQSGVPWLIYSLPADEWSTIEP